MRERKGSVSSAISKDLSKFFLGLHVNSNEDESMVPATVRIKQHLSSENGEFSQDQGSSTQGSSSTEEDSSGGTTLYDTTSSNEQTSSSTDPMPSKGSKLSFFKRLLSKFRFSFYSINKGIIDSRQEIEDHSPFLSSYGTLISERLGQGVSAKVQLVSDANETFAVKIFRKRRKTESKSLYMKVLASEYCIAQSLCHENIVQTFDFVRLDNRPHRYCIVMEYCPDGDLYSLIKRGEMPDNEVFYYFKQLMQGLDYMHGLGVAHRDLKPENLLLQNGVLKIADFGSADVFRVAWQETSRLSDGLCGTTPYMAPEIFTADGYWGPPVDMWAAGVVLFCMKCNGVPFGIANSSDRNYSIYMRARPTRQYRPFERFEKKHREVIYRLLHPVATRRITARRVLDWIEDTF